MKYPQTKGKANTNTNTNKKVQIQIPEKAKGEISADKGQCEPGDEGDHI